jgi:hypothetical protein
LKDRNGHRQITLLDDDVEVAVTPRLSAEASVHRPAAVKTDVNSAGIQ